MKRSAPQKEMQTQDLQENEDQIHLEKKMSNVNAIREMIKHPANEQENSANNGTIIEGGDIMIEQIVQKKFRDWLVNSGNVREIADLICLEKACKGDS